MGFMTTDIGSPNLGRSDSLIETTRALLRILKVLHDLTRRKRANTRELNSNGSYNFFSIFFSVDDSLIGSLLLSCLTAPRTALAAIRLNCK